MKVFGISVLFDTLVVKSGRLIKKGCNYKETFKTPSLFFIYIYSLLIIDSYQFRFCKFVVLM